MSRLILKKVSDSKNIFLVEPFLEEEVKLAVWSCGGNKSPGPDEFTFKFVKKMWLTLKKYIMLFMTDFHKYGRIVKGGKPYFFTLIPKKTDASILSDFLPISLTGCMYKIVAKLLAKRLTKVVISVILEF